MVEPGLRTGYGMCAEKTGPEARFHLFQSHERGLGALLVDW